MKSPNEAIARAYAVLGTGHYLLGGTDLPQPDGQRLSRGRGFRPGWRMDCAGLVLWAYDIPRHEPGANRGPWATVEDDWNTDSMIEDSQHHQARFFPVDRHRVREGDIVVYHTSHADGLTTMGHTALVVGVKPSDGSITVIQCHGPNGAVAAVETPDTVFQLHDRAHPHNPSVYLRVKRSDP